MSRSVTISKNSSLLYIWLLHCVKKYLKQVTSRLCLLFWIGRSLRKERAYLYIIAFNNYFGRKMIDETMLITEPTAIDFQESLNNELLKLVYDRHVIIKDIKFHTDENGYYGLVCFENR